MKRNLFEHGGKQNAAFTDVMNTYFAGEHLLPRFRYLLSERSSVSLTPNAETIITPIYII